MANIRIGLLAAILLTASTASADPPKYVTVWSFNVGDAMIPDVVTGSMTMPTGSSWSCIKESATVMRDGKLSSGFHCTNDGWTTLVHIAAACDTRKDSLSDASMGLADVKTRITVVVGVSCKTGRL